MNLKRYDALTLEKAAFYELSDLYDELEVKVSKTERSLQRMKVRLEALAREMELRNEINSIHPEEGL